MKDDFTVIIDTREQLPWEFELHATAKKKLDTGDYSIEGLEHLLCIERKKSVSEIANNITEKRFQNVLNRMSVMQYPFMLFEFDMEDVYSFPVGSDIPKRLWDSLKISSNYILKYLTQIQLNYRIHILFCGGPENAEKMAVSIMKRVYEKHNNQQNSI